MDEHQASLCILLEISYQLSETRITVLDLGKKGVKGFVGVGVCGRHMFFLNKFSIF